MDDCIFCGIAAGKMQATKVYEDADYVAFLDIRPVQPGHTLVIPKKHFERFESTPPEVVAKLFTVVHKIAPGIAQGVGADGFNLGLNNGPAAGQVVFHTHAHIIPRIPKDGLALWVGREYGSEAEREQVAQKIRAALQP